MSDPGPPETLEEALSSWDGHAVVARRDGPTGSWIFIAVHDVTLGPAVGGCRLRTYASAAAGLRDGQRLAEGMTAKWAILDLPCGGGKAVLAVPGPLRGPKRRGLLLRFGRLLESLRGAFATGRDLGTTDADMQTLAEVTSHVHGVDRTAGRYTALGLVAALRSTAARVFGEGELRHRTILVQGLGDVGAPLARNLADAGARLLLCDVDAGRAKALAAATGGQVVPPEAAPTTRCDIFAPCAMGGVLDASSIRELRCRAVAGSANNQLAEPADAERLHRRGILYAPDFVANAGAALALMSVHLGAEEAELERRLDGIGATLTAIFQEAAERDESPAAAARRRVERRLKAARARPTG